VCRASQKIGNVGQVANLPKTRQIGNLPHVGMLHIYCDGPYVACGRPSGGVAHIRWALLRFPSGETRLVGFSLNLG
jgi:hypothetical protein